MKTLKTARKSKNVLKLKQIVLSFFRKLARDGDCLMSVGREFHTRGPVDVRVCMCVLVTPASCAKTAEPDAVWDIGSCEPKETCITPGACWRHLANMTERPVRGVASVPAPLSIGRYQYLAIRFLRVAFPVC